jgi:hypothetical protein
MRGANVGSWYAMPLSIVPDLGQRPENSVQPSSKQRCHVLQHNRSRLQFSNQANGLKEQSASLSVKPCPEPGVGNILARKAACDDVNPFEVVCSTLPDVSFPMYFRPVLFEYLRRVVIDFNLPPATHSASLKT